MTTTILGVIISVIALICTVVGALAGHARGKSVGAKEGAQQAGQQQEIIQARETVKAVRERAHVEAEVGAADIDDLDRELSNHGRPD